MVALLALIHNMVAYAVFNRSNKKTNPRLPRFWAPLLATISVTGVCLSNRVLQTTNVSFHQLCKVLVIPASALTDYFIFHCKHGSEAICFHVLVVAGAILAISGMGWDGQFALSSVLPIALSFVSLTSSSTAATRYVHSKYQIHAAELVGLVTPYSFLVSLVMYLGLQTIDSHASIAAPNQIFEQLHSRPLKLLLNTSLACSVQFLSAWAASTSTNTLYAVIGQLKTLATIVLSAFFEHEELSVRVIIGTLIVLIAAIGATSAEILNPSKNFARAIIIILCIFTLSTYMRI